MLLRYSFTLDKSKTARRYNLPVSYLPESCYNIVYGTEVPIIPNLQPRALSLANWGIGNPYQLPLEKTAVLSLKTILSRTYYRNLLIEKRCLILADGFYLWKKVNRKSHVPYRIALKWNLPFTMAGIWNDQVNEETGEVSRSYAIVSIPASPMLQPFSEQVPCILSVEAEAYWLSEGLTDLDSLKGLLTSYPEDKLKLYPVSTRLADPAYNQPELFKPVKETTDQLGNYLLFS
jgi:putative SOS response-associated peptidase YedK